MLPVHKNALKRPYRLHLGYEFGTDPKENWAAQFERNKRGIQAADAVVKDIYYPNQNKPVYDPGNPPTPISVDRWHKYSDFRITVSKKHRATSDNVPESDAFDTIGDAITFAKTYYAALAVIYTDPLITIEVHGGRYEEHITIDVSYLRFRGIGLPVITLAEPDFSPVITITVDCLRVYFDGFEVINLGGEGYDWNLNAGLVVEEGVQSGLVRSDIWITNCYFHGTGTQIYSQRWAYYENCRMYSTDNYDSVGDPGNEASVVVRFCTSPEQVGWTQFVRCSISGQDDKGDPTKKGKALSVYALESDLSTWVSNTRTVGPYTPPSGGPPPTIGGNFPAGFARSGVVLQWCEIIGWAEHLGWALEFFEPQIIQGKFVTTPIGAVFLTQRCQTNDGVTEPKLNISTFTWFKGGNGKVTYLVQYTDTNGVTNTAMNEVWVKHFEHSAPKLAAGGSCMLVFGAGAPIGHLYQTKSQTSMQFWLNAGDATINGDGAAVGSNMNHILNTEGYLSV